MSTTGDRVEVGPTYELEDRFTADVGTVFLSGIQALARLPLEQLRADRRAGHRTAAFVAGYPGSPLGGYDGAVRAAARLAPDLPIVCRPSVNEEYAATAVMGSQLAASLEEHRYDGVLGLWYGKAPGVDRATDALRHAVYAGTSRLGGAVALVGDDPSAKSSTLPSSSAGVLADLHMPLLYPGDPAEALDLGRHAVALSRCSGLWVALKIVADVADGTASVDLDADRVRPVIPTEPVYDRLPEGRLLTPLTLDLEREIYEVRYEIARAYASANELNRVTADPPDAWIGIVASGITYREMLEAFDRLGLTDEAAIAACGIRLIEMQMPIPFDARVIRHFARGLDEVFVVEEKQPNLELLIKDALYGATDRPVVVGKHDEAGGPLIPGYGSLDADHIIDGLRARLGQRLGDRLAPPTPRRERIAVAATVARTPFYCSGCPHNRSTEVPHGAIVGAGIGCHTMALLVDPERVGKIVGLTPMGNEGTQWIGMSPFVDREHFIQNLGDGTYFHSGQLAITAAIAAGVNITYKLLFNGAIAMTGGQDPQGRLALGDVVAILRHQGVAEIILTSDDPARTRAEGLPAGTEVWDRSRIVEAQEHLATVPGVTVLIHDQRCAAELRRDRKRGRATMPTHRIAINLRVCEGCGDCGQVSNCLSVQPVDTPFGRKTRIDQTSCNLDESCLEGDCPSFAVVETQPTRWQRWLARRFQPRTLDVARPGPEVLDGSPLPPPTPLVASDDVSIRIAGVGGTGVVTVAQVLGTAATLDGSTVRGLDQTGLSQKAGPVVSDVRITRDHQPATNRLGSGQADLLLAFDQLVAASPTCLDTCEPGHTVVVGSTSQTPTGAMITHPDLLPPSPEELGARIAECARVDQQHWVDAEAVAEAVFGNAVTANMIVVGMAVQVGAIPIDPDRIEEAIRLNGVAVESNVEAFRLGRRLIVDPDLVVRLGLGQPVPETLDQLVDRLAQDLVGYQDEEYAAEFRAFVDRVAAAEAKVAGPSRALTRTVAIHLHKLMAYKDEYEVARLLSDPEGRAPIEELRTDGSVVSYRLHPPVLRALGLGRKMSFGPWSEPLFRRLAAAKGLRRRRWDPFGWPKVRREERKLPREYRAAIESLLPRLAPDNLADAVAVAGLPDLVRGYEELKLERIGEYRSRLVTATAAFGS